MFSSTTHPFKIISKATWNTNFATEIQIEICKIKFSHAIMLVLQVDLTATAFANTMGVKRVISG